MHAKRTSLAMSEMIRAVREKAAEATVVLEEDPGGEHEASGPVGGGARGDGVGFKTDPYAAAMANAKARAAGWDGEPDPSTACDIPPGTTLVGDVAIVRLAVVLDEAMYTMAYHSSVAPWIDAGGDAGPTTPEARSFLHRSPYDRVGVVDAVS